jgi:hypothetical protein
MPDTDIAGDNAAALDSLDLDEVEDDDLIRYTHMYPPPHMTHVSSSSYYSLDLDEVEDDDVIRYTHTHT